MKKTLFTFVILLLAVVAQAQIKVHNNGKVSLGSLTQTYGVQVHPLDYTSFRSQHNDNWSWVEISLSNVEKQKHWIVKNLELTSNTHTFFVTTDGTVYINGCCRVADANTMNEVSSIIEAGAVLDSITGVWYTPTCERKKGEESRRHVGVSAQELKKVLPEAVTADENGLLYVDYEVLTVFLIEAVKEQRQEIIALRKTLEENSLMKK